MDTWMVTETADILKRLSPNNQAYFMTLVRVAEVAESGIKSSIEQTDDRPV